MEKQSTQLPYWGKQPDKRPSQEQIQKFWERCGFIHQRDRHVGWVYSEDSQWMYPDGTFQGKLPPIDLNNLFKYSMSKLAKENRLAIEFVLDKLFVAICENKDLALALFRAIWQIVEEEK